jgi:PAS domain S-box-containing protein
VEGLDYRGVPVVAALRVIPDSPWSLVARMDLAEVLAPLREQLRLVVVLIGALLLGAGAGIALLWRQQSVRFYRERAAATETIRETNEYLENLFNYANAPIVVWDLQFKITRFNHAFESLTGRKAGEVFGQSLEILFPRALVDSSMALIKKTTGGERWETVEISIVHRDGSFRTVLWNSATVFAADGKNPVATIAQGHDITEHKQAEVTLRESEKRFRSLAVATSQIIWSTDAQGQVCGPMPSFQAYTGQSDEEIRGSGWAATLHPDDVARTIEVWQEAVAAKTGYLTEYRLRRRDGVYRHFTARGAPVVTDDGRILEWIGTCSDITERKQAEEKLRESEARFRKVFEMAPLPLCHVTKAGVIAFRNERFVRVFGYTADEVPTLAEWWLRAYPDPHYRQWVTETWDAAVRRAAAEGRDIDPVEYKVACKSGDERVVEISGITLGEEFLATFIDLTERKRMEEALNAQKQRLEKASAAGNVALWDWDLISGVLEWSSAVDPMLGFGKDKFPRTIRAWGEALHPDDAARVTEALNRHHRGEASYEIDYRVRRTDGSYIWWHVIGVAERDAAGKAVRMTGSCVDITERKRAEEEASRMVTVVRDSNDAITIQDFEGRITAWNHGAELMYGYSEEEALAANIDRLRTPGKVAEQKDFIRRLIAGEAITSFETQRVTKDGRVLDVWMTVTKLLDEAGKPVGLASTERDITARKRAEEEIHQLNAGLEQRVVERTAQLEAANKELEAFSYSVSHDLRAPLRHVQGYVDMLAREAGSQFSDKGRRYMTTIADASRELGVLIDDMLAFSRMGRAEMGEASVNLDEMVQDTLGDLEPATRGRNIVWKIPPLPGVQGDPAMLRQVLANLLGNAVKYSRPRDPAEIEFGCDGTEDGRVIFFVRDNGVGFNPQYVHKLFGVFQRLHRADEFEGTGIGLANVRRIIARHGGRTWAAGAVDKGATFYFTLKPSTSTNPTN